MISIFSHRCSSSIGFSMYCRILSNLLSLSLRGVLSRLAKCTTASFLEPYDISQMVRVFCKMLVGRTWSFNTRFIRLLFPALVSPVKNTNIISHCVQKLVTCTHKQVDIMRAANAPFGQITISHLPHHREHEAPIESCASLVMPQGNQGETSLPPVLTRHFPLVPFLFITVDHAQQNCAKMRTLLQSIELCNVAPIVLVWGRNPLK